MRHPLVARSLAALAFVSAAIAASPSGAVPFEARPPNLRSGQLLLDPTFVGAVADARLREIVADIHAGNSEIAKRKLVLFLQALPGNIQALEILGTMLLNEGKTAQAENILRQAAAVAPEQVSLRTRLAVALLNEHKFAEAAPHLQFAIEREPDNVLALTNYAWLLAVLEHNQQALQVYERLRDKKFEGQINRTELFVGLTVLYLRLGLHDRTIALLEPEFAKVTAPHINNRLFLNLFDAYLTTGKRADAARVLARLEPLIPADHPGTTLARARLLAANGDRDGAAAILAKALKTFPAAAADIHLTLARIEMARKYYRRAKDAFLKSAEAATAETRPAVLSEMAKSFAAENRSADVTAVLERFSTTAGGDGEIALLLVENLVQTDRRTDALALIERLVTANPKLARAWLLKGIVLRGEKRTADARAAIRKSVDIDPANPAAWSMLADLAHDTEGDAAMVSVLKEGLSLNPTDPHLLLGVGSLSYSQGDLEYAVEIFSRMIARFPDDPIALSNLALAGLDLGKDPETARGLLKRALERAPRIPAIVDTWGWMLLKTGKAQEAVDLLLRVAQAIPDDGGVQYHLGLAYAGIGQDGRGRGALRKALALGVPKHYRADIERRLAAK